MPSRVAAFAPRRARVEIIPLIDVIFFLLATFVLFTLSMNMLRTLPVVLPHGDHRKGDENPELVTILVSGEGVIFWNKEMIEASEVPARLELFKNQADSPRVLIAGDDRARFGATVAVLDQVNQAGIARVSVETKPRAAGQ